MSTEQERRLYRPAVSVEPTIAEVAEWIGGDCFDADAGPERITGMSTLDEAEAGELSFVASGKYAKAAAESSAGVFIVPRGVEVQGRARIEVDVVWPAVVQIMQRLFVEARPKSGIHPTAILGQHVQISETASIGPYCVIGDGAKIGDNSILESHCSIPTNCAVGDGCHFHASVVLQGDVIVGDNVILHSGVVIGADGFRFELGSEGFLKIPQIGRVIIEDDVDVGANTTIDRPFLHETRIRKGTKIDNQVQIGHNCDVGPHVVLAGCIAMAGSVRVEEGCFVGGQAAFTEGVTVGKGSMISGMAGISKSFGPGSMLIGVPARDMKQFVRMQSAQKMLPSLNRRVRTIEETLSSNGLNPPEDNPPKS